MLDLILFAGLIVFIHQTAWFAVSLLKKDSSVADIAWGLGFIFVAVSMLKANESIHLEQVILALLISLWGLRLAWHIFRRKKPGQEDWRYKKWRSEWGKFFTIRSYLQNFIFQGLLMLVIAMPVVVAAACNSSSSSLNLVQVLGIIVWLLGFGFEVIADKQLKSFLANRKHDDEIMQTGLWKYSRHPNYFGEMTLWWGLWLITFGSEYFWLGVVSPITISFLLMFVSGVPLLEKKYKNNKKYQEYAKRTCVLVPFPPKEKK